MGKRILSVDVFAAAAAHERLVLLTVDRSPNGFADFAQRNPGARMGRGSLRIQVERFARDRRMQGLGQAFHYLQCFDVTTLLCICLSQSWHNIALSLEQNTLADLEQIAQEACRSEEVMVVQVPWTARRS